MRISVSSTLEVVGILAIIVAGFAWDWRAGLAVIGFLCVVVGYMTGGGDAE